MAGSPETVEKYLDCSHKSAKSLSKANGSSIALTKVQWMCHRSCKTAGRPSEPEGIVHIVFRLLGLAKIPWLATSRHVVVAGITYRELVLVV